MNLRKRGRRNIRIPIEASLSFRRNSEVADESCNPSSVKSGEANKGRLAETMPGIAFIFFVTFVKKDDIPGFSPNLTEKGSEVVCKNGFDPLSERVHKKYSYFARCPCEAASNHFAHSLSVAWHCLPNRHRRISWPSKLVSHWWAICFPIFPTTGRRTMKSRCMGSMVG